MAAIIVSGLSTSEVEDAIAEVSAIVAAHGLAPPRVVVTSGGAEWQAEFHFATRGEVELVTASLLRFSGRLRFSEATSDSADHKPA